MALRTAGMMLMLLTLLGTATSVMAGDNVLRVVPHADLKVLDPHTNTATITLMHGAMIYDTLFAWDSKIRPHPQMVDTFQISPDGLVHTYTLRPGLKFHDGQPVTTKDVIPSIKRWMVRNTIGQVIGQVCRQDRGERRQDLCHSSQGTVRFCRIRARRVRRRHHARHRMPRPIRSRR